MVDSMDIYKSLNINIGIVMKNPEMLKFVPSLVKTVFFIFFVLVYIKWLIVWTSISLKILILEQ